jgi:hypothetical protein
MSRNRPSRLIVAMCAASMALVALVMPVAAGSPQQQVHIVSNVTFNDNGPNYGDFLASGTAADNGLICQQGTFVDTWLKFGGYERGTGAVQVHVRKLFTCDDGSGTFSVKLEINGNYITGYETFNWVVQDGTGAYAQLHGTGSGYTVPTSTGNVNTYDGSLH